MAESIRFHARDSLYALIATYLMNGSRDILANFDTSLDESKRLVTIDNISFKIVRRILTQQKEVPGINIYFADEFEQPIAGPDAVTSFVSIHLYQPATASPVADERTLLKLQRLIDEALHGRSLDIVDFYAIPKVKLNKIIHWEFVGESSRWDELTNLQTESFLHRSKALQLSWREAIIV